MRSAAASVVLAGAVLATSCSEPSRPIRVAIHSAPIDLDPHFQNESLTLGILGNIYEGLTDFDEVLGTRPRLAESWTNPDERTWVFRLRRGVRFHDETPVGAQDVVRSLERARSVEGSALASYLVEVETLRALDERTVEIRTRRPFAALLARLAQVYVVPRDAPARIVSPVGTGPYRLVRYGGGVLELAPAGTSTGESRGVTPVTFVVEPDADARLRKLLAGEVDVAANLPGTSVAVLRGSGSCRAEVLPGSTVEYLHFAWIDARFRDRRVREAIHLAIDRVAYVAEAHGGLGQPISQMAAPGVFGYAPDLRPPARDVARGRALLAEAGHPEGFDVVLEQRPGRRGDVLARQLAEAGLRVTLRQTPWGDLYRRLQRGDVGFYFGGVVSPTAEASDVLDGWVHSRDAARGYGMSNHSRYSSPRADELIEAASMSFSLVNRRELLQEAMRVAMADLPFVPVAAVSQVYGVRQDLSFRPRVDLKLLGREMRRR